MPQPRFPARRFRIHLARTLLLASAAVLLHGCNGMFYQPDARIYRTRTPDRDPASSALEPSWPAIEDVTFATPDGTRLHGWFLRASGEPKGTVVHFHGNAQNLTSHVGFVDWLPAAGFHVFVFDYRGFGESAGSPSREGLHEDSLAALAYVRSRPGVDPQRIVVFAQSLGGACAVAALGEGGTQGIRGLALDSTFATYIGMGNEVLGGTFLTYPLAWLLLSNRHSAANAIAKIAPVPILFFHSTEDPVVPIAQGRLLFAAAQEPKEFVEVPVRGHPIATATRDSRARLVRFFTTCLAGPQ